MQTFLPYPFIFQSAMVLDKKRCWKQVVEAKQIVNAVVKLEAGHTKVGWGNHPAVKMWVGHLEYLKHYYNVFLSESIHNRSIDTKLQPMECNINGVKPPPWLFNKAFHDSHKSNLLRKDYKYYSQFGWDVPNNLKYVWPVK